LVDAAIDFPFSQAPMLQTTVRIFKPYYAFCGFVSTAGLRQILMPDSMLPGAWFLSLLEIQ
jgi:hypothetical protein